MDGSHRPYIEEKMPDSKGHVLNDPVYTEFKMGVRIPESSSPWGAVTTRGQEGILGPGSILFHKFLSFHSILSAFKFI